MILSILSAEDTLMTPLDPRFAQLRTWYDQLTARIAAADKDIGRALAVDLAIQLGKRPAELQADREIVAAYLDALERDKPLPGPWPPEFRTTDLLTAFLPRILFKDNKAGQRSNHRSGPNCGLA